VERFKHLDPKKCFFRNPYYIVPQGYNNQIVSHPTRPNKAIEIGVFQEHRYAFYSWLKWTRKLGKVPCLVSLDWHQDLFAPEELEKEWLLDLDQEDDGEVSFFCWAKLAGNNDGHILSAAYLNLIGNIYVHCRQGHWKKKVDVRELIDYQGNKHVIKIFQDYNDLEKELLNSEEYFAYFDIDLDFFTIENNTSNDKQKFTYLNSKQIEELLSPTRPIIKWVFERMEGMTIATEPECTGGLLKSNKLLEKINKLYFSPDLFRSRCNWKWKK
jgi:hypothetical protein